MPKKIKTTQIEYTVSTVKKKMLVSDGEVTLEIIIDKEHLGLVPKGGEEFVFKSKNAQETIKRWRKVVSCMQIAINVLEKERQI